MTAPRGVSVSVNGVDSPLFSVWPTEIVLEVPSQPGLERNVEVRVRKQQFVRDAIPNRRQQ